MSEAVQEFNEVLLPKPDYPESWECCGSECGDFCVYEIYSREKQAYDEQQKRYQAFLNAAQADTISG